MVTSAPLPSDHTIVVEFSRRKLAFVFKDVQSSQRSRGSAVLLLWNRALHGVNCRGAPGRMVLGTRG